MKKVINNIDENVTNMVGDNVANMVQGIINNAPAVLLALLNPRRRSRLRMMTIII